MRKQTLTPSTSNIASDLIANYLNANYQIGMEDNTITFHIGEYSESLSQLLAASGSLCAIFITAFNPLSKPQASVKNLAAHTQLKQALSYHSSLILEGESSDPSGTWSSEKSFLAFDVNLETAKEIGRQFRQNAIVWISVDAIPQLVLLR